MTFPPIKVEKIISFAALKSGMRVADFFAGRGHLTLPAAQRVGPAGRVWAVDQNDEWFPQIQHAARDVSLENVRTIRMADLMDAEALPDIPSHSLNAVIIFNNQLSASATELLIAHAARLLQPHGFLILGDVNNHSQNPYRDALGSGTSRHEAFLCAHDHGFSLVDECAPSRYHYALKMTLAA